MTTAATPLTDRQREVYRTILTLVRDTGRVPTMRELMVPLELASTNGVVAHLRPLAKKGLIVLSAKSARGIVVPELDAAIRAAAGEMLAVLRAEPTPTTQGG